MQIAILRAIQSDPARAYGAAITDVVSRATGHDLPDAQVYVALMRLEAQGFVAARIEETPVRSKRTRGRPRKFYAVTASGRDALESAGNYIAGASLVERCLNIGPRDDEGPQEGPMPAPVVG